MLGYPFSPFGWTNTESPVNENFYNYPCKSDGCAATGNPLIPLANRANGGSLSECRLI